MKKNIEMDGPYTTETKPVPKVRLLANDKLFLDGQEFPWNIVAGSLEIKTNGFTSDSRVTLTILADEDVVVKR